MTESRREALSAPEIVERFGLTLSEAEAMVRQKLTLDEWTARNPGPGMLAYRIRTVRENFPWLPAKHARSLVNDYPEDKELESALDRSMLARVGLPARLAAVYVRDGALPQDDDRYGARLAVLRERLATVEQAHHELDHLTRLRVAAADASLPEWPLDVSEEELRKKARAIRAESPVYDKLTAMRAARFGLTLGELARLSPKRWGHLPRALEIYRRHSNRLHRKTARSLALWGLDDDGVERYLAQQSVAQEMWGELAAAGPSGFVTYDGVQEGVLDPEARHPYLFVRKGASPLPKIEVVFAFAEPDRGAVLGRIKRLPELTAAGHGPAGTAVLRASPREAIDEAMRDDLSVRFVTRTGHAFSGRPRKASRFEYLVELKGGARVIVLRHALVEMTVNRPTTAQNGDTTGNESGGGKKGRKKKRKKRK